ncbi:MAG: metallophosphoesterase [Candidatus Thiodiazotropha taylori]
MKQKVTADKGFFSRLKSVFSNPEQCPEIALTEAVHLRKESAKVPLEKCMSGITLDYGGRTLSLVREQFVGDAHGGDGSAFLLLNPERFQTRISGFVRVSAGDHLIVGLEDDHQQAMLDLPASGAQRLFSIAHEGDVLIFKDLTGDPGTILTPIVEDELNITARRIANLREIYRIYGGPIQPLSSEQALEDLNKVNDLLEREPLRPRDVRGRPGGVVSLPKKMVPIIVGDLHAQIDNLLTLLTQNQFLEAMSQGKATMVILGDAVHSEMDGQMEEMESSLLMMDLILRLKLWFPQQVFYLRGNHDSFAEEIGKEGIPQGLLWARALREVRGDAYKKAMDRFYELLPFVVLSKSYVACHAAPPRGKVDMDMLINIHKYPGLIREVTCNRLSRPNRPAGYTKGDVKRFRRTLKLSGKAELFVGHTPLTRHDTLWSNVGGIEHHDVVFSGNIPWIGVYTSANGEMIPLRYRSESLLPILNGMSDVALYDELGPANTNPIGPVVPEKAPIKARGERFGDSK